MMKRGDKGRACDARTAAILILIMFPSGCQAPKASALQAKDMVGEYRGEVDTPGSASPWPIALSLRRDGSFLGDFPDPNLTYGGHTRAFGRWRPVQFDRKRGCTLIELEAQGRRARAHCVSREPDQKLGINCAEAEGGGRSCGMKWVRPADA